MVSWEYLWPTLRCRREAGVSPQLSIGWWYLSSVSLKRHCCRVSAAGKGCRVYPLDTHPDAVVLYSGCTPVPAVNKSSTSTQAELLPSTSSVTVTSPSRSQPPNSVIDTVPIASDNLSISAASSSSTSWSVLETTTTTSNTIPTISQDTNQTSKPRRKKRPPKNQSNTIKPKIEIKMAPHRPRKSAPTEYTTDEEDMTVYDVWKMSRIQNMS
ncbi:uncharacterized protein TNCV_131631 [Trichonephila clavipes]|nr:uncharacterized protein TNCV_131631 [Trichonephila clavipes]